MYAQTVFSSWGLPVKVRNFRRHRPRPLRRRHQRRLHRIRDLPVAECMTADPARIGSEALATEALRLLEEGRITCLTVTDESSRLVGVVHLHDLWRTQMI